MSPLKTLRISAALIVLALSTHAARSGDDCDTVITDVKEQIEIAAKNYEHSIGEVKAAANQTTAKNHFCAVTGEFLGISTAFRALVSTCGGDGAATASLDKSIKEIQASLDSACK